MKNLIIALTLILPSAAVANELYDYASEHFESFELALDLSTSCKAEMQAGAMGNDCARYIAVYKDTMSKIDKLVDLVNVKSIGDDVTTVEEAGVIREAIILVSEMLKRVNYLKAWTDADYAAQESK